MSELAKKMNVNSTYRSAVDGEIEKISNADLKWVKDLEVFQNHTFHYKGKEFIGVLSCCFDKGIYSVTLKLERKLVIGYRSFLAGFTFDSNGNVYPISDKLLYAND